VLTPSLSPVDAGVWNAVQHEIEAVESVQRALFDQPAGRVWVIADPGADADSIDAAVRDAIRSRGADPASLAVEVVFREIHGARERVRLLQVERGFDADGRLRMRVILEWKGQRHTGEAVGERGGPIELRTAAAATIDALQKVTEGGLEIRLIGIKQTRAFDADLMIASLWSGGTERRRLVGAVLDSGDANQAVARAVLHAMNRLLGNFLHRE
jgi:hypothetical protein